MKYILSIIFILLSIDAICQIHETKVNFVKERIVNFEPYGEVQMKFIECTLNDSVSHLILTFVDCKVLQGDKITIVKEQNTPEYFIHKEKKWYNYLYRFLQPQTNNKR